MCKIKNTVASDDRRLRTSRQKLQRKEPSATTADFQYTNPTFSEPSKKPTASLPVHNFHRNCLYNAKIQKRQAPRAPKSFKTSSSRSNFNDKRRNTSDARNNAPPTRSVLNVRVGFGERPGRSGVLRKIRANIAGSSAFRRPSRRSGARNIPGRSCSRRRRSPPQCPDL